MPSPPNDLLKKFEMLIYDRSSLYFSPSRLGILANQLSNRLQGKGISSYETYLHMLQKDRKELDALIDALTTKETYFFRLPDQFKAFQEHVVPTIEERLSSEVQKHLAFNNGNLKDCRIYFRIWSAGVSTGEEAYSLAMSLMEALRYPRAWRVEILATDISEEAVRTASKGFYETNVAKNIPGHLKIKYTTDRKKGVVISKELHEKISFCVFNLRELCPENSAVYNMAKLDRSCERINLEQRFHVIFCRNVMIYFDLPAQQRLIHSLYQCLQPGGYLFTGDAEPLHPYEHKFETIEHDGVYFYRKPEKSEQSLEVKTNVEQR